MEPGFESSPHSQAGWDPFTTRSVRHGVTQAMGGQRLMGTRAGALILEAKDPKCQGQGSEAYSDEHRDQEPGKRPWGPKTWQWGGRTPSKPTPQGTVLMVEVRNARETRWSVDVQGGELMQFLLDNTLSNLTAPDSKNYTRHKNPTSRYGLQTFQGALNLHHISKPSYFSQNSTKMQSTCRLGQGQRHYSRYEFYC